MGSNKLMHTVIEAYCTGCELCLPVCPVDCIQLENVTGTATGWNAWSRPQADLALKRYEFHCYKVKRDEDENAKRLEAKALMKLADLGHHSQHTDPAVLDKKRAVIEAALARARARQLNEQSTASSPGPGYPTGE
jgi:electron transport complex protein RnfB